MHLVTKRPRMFVGIAILLALLSTTAYFQLIPKQSTPAHAVSGSIQTAPGYPAFRCVARPNVSVPPAPPNAKSTTDGVVHQPLCPAGQVPQPEKTTPTGPVSPPRIGMSQHEKTPATCPCFLYTQASMPNISEIGVGATLAQPNPYLDTTHDYHSLTEIAGVDSSINAMEEGNTVDKNLNGDLHTYLFVSHWEGNTWKGYNNTDGTWVQVSTTRTPGMQVTATSINPQEYYIEYIGSPAAWWVWYQTEWIGYFPASDWSGNFTQTNTDYWYGEVSAGSFSPCTDMGNGNFGSNSSATRPIINGVTPSGATFTSSNTTWTISNSSYYDVDTPFYGGTTLSFHYGGPGSGGVVKGC